MKLNETENGLLMPLNVVRPERWLNNGSFLEGEDDLYPLLTAIVRMLKPVFIVETGTCRGLSTLAFAEGLECNKEGKIVTLEISKEFYSVAEKNFSKSKFEKRIVLKTMSSFKYLPEQNIDLLFLDAWDREEEFFHFLPFLSVNGVVLLHDAYVPEFKKFIENINGTILPTPRGLGLWVCSPEKKLDLLK